MRPGGSSITDLSAAAPVSTLDFEFSAPLERMFHEPGDIRLVLDYENFGLAQFVHPWTLIRGVTRRLPTC